MGKTLVVGITESAGEIHDLRYRFIWSAWLNGELLGKGHAFNPDQAIALAQELVDPEDIERIDIDYRAKDRPGASPEDGVVLPAPPLSPGWWLSPGPR